MKVTPKKRGPVIADLTPMIDVIFQLILFFLVSTTIINDRGIKLVLPDSETAQAVEVTSITLTVDDRGRLFFNDEKSAITQLQLEEKLMALADGDKKPEEIPVTLEADENVKNGQIVKLFDSFRKCGFVSISLRTKV